MGLGAMGRGAVGLWGLKWAKQMGQIKMDKVNRRLGKGVAEIGGNGLGAVALWGCAAVRIEVWACGLGLGAWGVGLGAVGAVGLWGLWGLKWAKQIGQIKMDKVNWRLGKGVAEIGATGLGLWGCGAVRL